jgi:hypothetical protein
VARARTRRSAIADAAGHPTETHLRDVIPRGTDQRGLALVVDLRSRVTEGVALPEEGVGEDRNGDRERAAIAVVARIPGRTLRAPPRSRLPERSRKLVADLERGAGVSRAAAAAASGDVRWKPVPEHAPIDRRADAAEATAIPGVPLAATLGHRLRHRRRRRCT